MQSVSRLLAVMVVAASVFSLAAAGEPHLAAARRFAAAGDWRQAERLSRLHLQSEPQNPDATLLHAEALVHLRQPFDAVIEVEKSLEAHPDHVPTLKFYAALLVDVITETSRAEPVLNKAASLAPKDWQVWEALGKLHFRMRKPEESARAFQTAAELAPSNPEVASEFARALDEIDDAPRAEAQHRRALALNSALKQPLAAVHARFATFLYNRNRPEESLAAFNRALQIEPRSPDGLLGRATLHEKLGKLREAEADALAALRDAPERRDIHQLLIRVYHGLGDNAKVEREVATVKKLADAEQAELGRYRDLRASLNAAERLLAEGKLHEAIAPYEKIVGLVPGFYEAWFALGICHSQAGEGPRAEAALRRYLELQPLSADGHAALGLVLLAANRSAEAKPPLERALELNPALDEPRAALAKLALDRHENERALAYLDPLFKRPEPPDPTVYAMSASVRFSLGKKDDALSVCEQGLEKHPDSVELEELHTSFLIDCGRTEACRQRAVRWYTQRPRSPRYIRCMTELLVMNRPLEDATGEAVRKFAAANAGQASAHYLLARWERARSHFANARDEARRAAALAGADERMLLQCLTLEAIALEELSDFTAAEAVFAKALELNRRLNPPSAESAMWYVRFLLSAGRFEDAAMRAREVLAWNPRSGPAHFALARVADNAGRREEAAREAELLLKYGTSDPEQTRAAHVMLAKIYFALGRKQQAEAHQALVRTR